MSRWGRPLAISMVVHAAVFGSGALILSAQPEPTDTPSVFPVSLVFDPSVPGSPGSPGSSGLPGPLGPAALPVSHPAPAPAEKPLSARAAEAPVQTPPTPEAGAGPSESTGAGGGGDNGNGGGGGGGGSGHGDGNGGGGSPSTYQPPRLLAGALPLDPDKGAALTVPPEIPVRLRVGEDGRVKEIIPEITPLAPAVLDALHRSADAMRFAPARRGGQAVEGWFSMTFVYRH